MTVTRAVIPAAGFGTRFLPATKVVPKELLPIVDTPSIQLVVEEAAGAGLHDIVIVTGPDKAAIRDHFGRATELEAFLERKGKLPELERIRASADLASIRFVVQEEPLGLGHAVSVAERAVAGESFAVLLPDDLMHPEVPLLAEMLAAHERTGRSMVAAFEVAESEISAYGCIEPGTQDGPLTRVVSVVEKPAPEEAPSRLAVIGRYVFGPAIFDALRRIEPGVGGELQLTDAINLLASEQEVLAYGFDHGRFDTGTPLDYLKTVIEHGTERADIGPALRTWLEDFVERRTTEGRR